MYMPIYGRIYRCIYRVYIKFVKKLKSGHPNIVVILLPTVGYSQVTIHIYTFKMSTIPIGKQTNMQCPNCKWSDRPEDCGKCGGTGYVDAIDRPINEPSGPVPGGRQANAACHSCKWSDRPEDCNTCGGTGYVGDIDRPDAEPSGPVPGGPVPGRPVPGGLVLGLQCTVCAWSNNPQNCGVCGGSGTDIHSSLGVT